ncbi:MAG: Aspartyl-tRNA(Asn) amidotransferase subunit [Myxococcaceae bacterium]|nr:Aspartyl-tRNA(Asn) amidotransferase subunit [Myxococcaceae bacterium]
MVRADPLGQRYKRAMAVQYEAVIGLEVHAQLLTKSKLFCGCSASFGAPPNTQVCPVCLGLPGSLPVPNREAIHLAMRAGLAVGCSIDRQSRFARKNYFYPDLAKGYQISQFDLPLNVEGKLKIDGDDGEREVTIQRIHVEEDAAKNIHGAGGADDTLVDYNRAGVALTEIVGAPDLRSAAEAESYLRKLREILMFARVNDGNLEEGSFRCDANVSIRPVGTAKLGTRTELKNINSFRFVRKAIEYEIQRQEIVLAQGGKIVQETRTWNENLGKTVSMRTKEEAHDYRYFPDPDLPPIAIDDAEYARAVASVPELPVALRQRWQQELGLTAYDATVLSAHPEIARYVERAALVLVEQTGEPKSAAGKRIANFVQAEVLRYVETEGLVARFPVPAASVAALVALVAKGTLSGKMAKEVFEAMRETGKEPGAIIEERGLAQVSDTGAIEQAVRTVLENSQKQLAQYKGGNEKLFGFFVGQVMKATKGSANPALVNEVLKRVLEAS